MLPLHGKDLDRDHLTDELGDVLWYFFHTLNAFDISFDDVLEGNVRKLCARHPKNNGDPEQWLGGKGRLTSSDIVPHE